MSTTYKITKKTKNINYATILKSGIEANVTIHDLAQDVQGWVKTKIEMLSNGGIFQAMMINIERNYPIVKKLSNVELKAIAVYSQKTIQLEQANNNIKILDKNYASYSKEFKEIKNALGIAQDTDLDMALTEYKNIKNTSAKMIKDSLKNDKVKKGK